MEPSITQACVSVFSVPVTLGHSFTHISGHLFPKVREERYKGLEFISLSLSLSDFGKSHFGARVLNGSEVKCLCYKHKDVNSNSTMHTLKIFGFTKVFL